jgi:hypothetical protein
VDRIEVNDWNLRRATPSGKRLTSYNGAMHLHIVILILSVAGISVCGALSSVVNAKMVDQVNRKLPKDLRFAPFGWYYPKTQFLHREYRRLFPDGPLLWQGRTLLAMMLVCLGVSAWAMGFFGAVR